MAGATGGKRIDPKPRPTDGTNKWTALANKDPKKFYVWVPLNGLMNRDYYESMGYQVEVSRPDGVRTVVGRTTSGVERPIEFRGTVLMSISRAEKDRIDLEGEDGGSGQKSVDELERSVVRNKMFDPMRGQHGAYQGLHMHQEISALTPEG
jgi:hypothetical protein